MGTPKEIRYYTADPVATAAELVEIATLVDIAAADYTVRVMCGKPKATVTGITFAAVATGNKYTDAGASIAVNTLSVDETDNSINDSGSGLLAAGFQVGDIVTTAGFTTVANNGAKRLTAVTAAKATFAGADGDTLVTEGAGDAVTMAAPGRFLLRGFKVGEPVMVRGFTTSANNVDSVVPTAVTAGELTIGGTDGDVIADEIAGDTVTICTVAADFKYGSETPRADYVAGTIPEQCKSSGTPVDTVFAPTNPPDEASLIETQGVITHGETVVVKNSAGTTTDNSTAAVVAHAVTVALPATKAVVEHADTVNVGSDAVTLTVSSGALQSGSIGGTKTIVEAADTLALTTAGTVTFGVSGGTLTGDVAATTAVVANGAATTVSSKPITLAVSARTLGVATFTAGTDCAVSNGGTVAVVNSAGTATDNATAAVAGNAITNVALPATKTVVETADTVSVDGVSVPLVVSSGALAATTLIASGSTSKVITSGVEILASGIITTKVTVTIVDGVVTACVGG